MTISDSLPSSGEDGCPWDRVQTHESIRQNCLEEAYEVCEAIDEKDPDHLREELGDLLMQIIFHAGIEADAGRFDFNDVCDASCRKLIFRHPHVFGDRELNKGAEAAEVWEKAKRVEHGQASTADAIDGWQKHFPACGGLRKCLRRLLPWATPLNETLWAVQRPSLSVTRRTLKRGLVS